MTTAKGTNWCVVINNPTDADVECIAQARQRGWTVEGQKEEGENGTPHYQLYINTKGQQRFSALKKQFPRAHIEVARNPEALRTYSTKEATRIGTLPSTQEQYPSQAKVWAWFGEHYEYALNKYGKIVDGNLLPLFDEMIRKKTEEGYYVEMMGSNPQVRSCIKLYGHAIHAREQKRKTALETEDNISLITNTTNEDAEAEESSQETHS